MAKRSKSRPRRSKSKTRKMSKRSKKRTPAKMTGTTTKTKKTIVSSSGSNAHHAVRVNAFSNATAQPKILDGLMAQSLSRRLQNVVSVRNGDGTMGRDIMHVILFPSLGVPLVFGNSAEGFTLRNASSLDPSFVGFPNQTVGAQLIDSGTGSPVNFNQVTSLGQYKLFQKAPFSTWRIVSQALRLELTNNDEQNEGWFEAVRMNWRRNNSDLQITQLDGTASLTTTDFGIGPSPSFLNYVRDLPLTEIPGYQSGLLKDIKKYDFQLHPKSTTHDPIEMDRNIVLNEGSDLFVQTNTLNFSFGETNAANQIKDSYTDPNMDIVYLRLHCRLNNENTATSNYSLGSSFMVNLVQNIEMAFHPESDYASFQTKNVLDKRTAVIADKLNNDFTAGNKRRK